MTQQTPSDRKIENVVESILKEIRQAAMDYCGVWYSDYRMGDDVVVFDNQHREAMKSTIDQHGGIEQLAVALSMELVANSNQQSKIPS